MNLKVSNLILEANIGKPIQKKKKNFIVPGGLFEISKSDERKLDVYEDYPILYSKLYFKYYNHKVMTYIMNKKSEFRYPTERYLNVIKQGYKDCGLDKKYLKRALFNIQYFLLLRKALVQLKKYFS